MNGPLGRHSDFFNGRDDTRHRVKSLASALGLTVAESSAKALVLWGRIDGVDVECDTELSFDGYHAKVDCRAKLAPNLGMHVQMNARLIHINAETVLDERFDEDLQIEFDLQSLHTDELVNLVEGNVGSTLIKAAHAGFRPQVDDKHVRLSALVGSYSEMKDVVQSAVRCAQLLIDRRRQIPRSRFDQIVIAAWEPAEQAFDATFSEDELTLIARKPYGDVTARVQYIEKRLWRTFFELRLARDLPLTVDLKSASAVSKWRLLFDPDVRTGDEVFDKAVIVRGKPVDQLRTLLDDGLRAAISGLVTQCELVEINEHGVLASVGYAISGTDELKAIVGSLCTLGEALHARGRRQQGAYR